MLQELGLFGLEKKQLQEEVTASCPYLQWGHQEERIIKMQLSKALKLTLNFMFEFHLFIVAF